MGLSLLERRYVSRKSGYSLFQTSEADADASEVSMRSEFVTHCVCSLRMFTSLASASALLV